MSDKIFIIQKSDLIVESKKYFDYFNENFNHLHGLELLFPSEALYPGFNDDLKTIDRGWSEQAELIDTRRLDGYENDPVRILLTKDFFDLDNIKRNEAILHELGHYWTNSSLQEIRDYIAKENPKTLSINHSTLKNLVNAHNEGLNYIFQIPKLVQEVNAELWVYENEKVYSKTRINRYCETIKTSQSEFNKASVNEGWFFQIPKINFLILWRLSIFKHIQFDYILECIDNANKINEAFKNLAKKAGWGHLKLFELQEDVLTCLDYKRENISRLCGSYEQIFEDYIRNSAKFFPEDIPVQLFKFYGI